MSTLQKKNHTSEYISPYEHCTFNLNSNLLPTFLVLFMIHEFPKMCFIGEQKVEQDCGSWIIRTCRKLVMLNTGFAVSRQFNYFILFVIKTEDISRSIVYFSIRYCQSTLLVHC